MGRSGGRGENGYERRGRGAGKGREEQRGLREGQGASVINSLSAPPRGSQADLSAFPETCASVHLQHIISGPRHGSSAGGENPAMNNNRERQTLSLCPCSLHSRGRERHEVKPAKCTRHCPWEGARRCQGWGRAGTLQQVAKEGLTGEQRPGGGAKGDGKGRANILGWALLCG